jgi:hypothetical protein
MSGFNQPPAAALPAKFDIGILDLPPDLDVMRNDPFTMERATAKPWVRGIDLIGARRDA